MEKIKFTVIIPTRERPDTLYHSLRTVVDQDYENLTIIVSDNFSQDDTKSIVNSFADSRIRYINTGKRISMSHNYEFALSHVTDGWVTIVGDDDGLLPGALTKVADVINRTGCKAITSKLCYYFWPNSTIADNRLIVPLSSDIEIRDGRRWLGKLMRGDTLYHELPYIYTGGFSDIAVINQARGADGSFFLSMIPDVYSGIALASVLDNYVMMKTPVALAGISSHSSGASQLGTGKNLAPAQKFFSEGNIPFHAKLAGGEVVKSIPILVYECYLQAMHLHKDFLRVRINEQLALALALAQSEPKKYGEIRDYCNDIAQRNGCDMKGVLKKAKAKNRYRFFMKILGLKGYWQMIKLDASQFNALDVYSAAQLSNHIYVFNTMYKAWRCKKIIAILKRLLHKQSVLE